MPTITGNTPDLSQLPPWATSGQWLTCEGPAPTAPAASVPPGLPVGSVLGVVTATGAYTLCDPAVSPPDGSQVPSAILASYYQAGPPPVPATVYTGGTFSTPRLFYSANWTLAGVMSALGQAGFGTRTPAAVSRGGIF